MSEELMKKLVENNLDYAELLLIPETTGLELINKDAGLGNITPQQQLSLRSWFDSLHIFQKFTLPLQFPVKILIDSDGKEQLIPINFANITKEQFTKEVDKGTMKLITQDIPRYPKTFQCLRSKISTMNITSGSVEGFRALLQHSTIQRTKQEQTLEDLTSIKKNKKRGNNNGNTN